MTQKLAENLIKYYEENLKEIRKMNYVDDIHYFLIDKDLYAGICNCSQKIFSENIYNDKWVNSFGNQSNKYWFENPLQVETKEEIVQSLQMRIDRLKTFSENTVLRWFTGT